MADQKSVRAGHALVAVVDRSLHGIKRVLGGQHVTRQVELHRATTM